jgi:hypothetical protein
VPAVLEEAGFFYLRVIVYEVHPSVPFLESPPILVEAWGRRGRHPSQEVVLDCL